VTAKLRPLYQLQDLPKSLQDRLVQKSIESYEVYDDFYDIDYWKELIEQRGYTVGDDKRRTGVSLVNYCFGSYNGDDGFDFGGWADIEKVTARMEGGNDKYKLLTNYKDFGFDFNIVINNEERYRRPLGFREEDIELELDGCEFEIGYYEYLREELAEEHGLMLEVAIELIEKIVEFVTADLEELCTDIGKKGTADYEYNFSEEYHRGRLGEHLYDSNGEEYLNWIKTTDVGGVQLELQLVAN